VRGGGLALALADLGWRRYAARANADGMRVVICQALPAVGRYGWIVLDKVARITFYNLRFVMNYSLLNHLERSGTDGIQS
jgi:hypothetical protein